MVVAPLQPLVVSMSTTIASATSPKLIADSIAQTLTMQIFQTWGKSFTQGIPRTLQIVDSIEG
jgi:hypothetical protein